LARNHAFADGNKRIAWIAARLFLIDNGQQLQFARADALAIIEGVAAGTIGEAALAQWFRERIEWAATLRSGLVSRFERAGSRDRKKERGGCGSLALFAFGLQGRNGGGARSSTKVASRNDIAARRS